MFSLIRAGKLEEVNETLMFERRTMKGSEVQRWSCRTMIIVTYKVIDVVFLFRLNVCVKSVVSHGGQQLLKDGNYGMMQIWMEVNYLTTILSLVW